MSQCISLYTYVILKVQLYSKKLIKIRQVMPVISG